MATFHENLVQSFTNFKNKFLKANGKDFHFAYDSTTQKYGYTIDGTFYPFRKVQASKTVTAGTSAITVTPDTGNDGVASVTVNPTPSETKTQAAGTSNIDVTPTSGKLLSKVTVTPTPSQSKSVDWSTSTQTVSPDSGKLLSSVSVGATPDARNSYVVGTLTSADVRRVHSLSEIWRVPNSDNVVRTCFELPASGYYTNQDIIAATDAQMRGLGWKLGYLTYNVYSGVKAGQLYNSLTTTAGGGQYIIIIAAINNTSDMSESQIYITDLDTSNGDITYIQGIDLPMAGYSAGCKVRVYSLNCSANARVSWYGHYAHNAIAIKLT